jgi:hypothetical protein
MAPNTPHNDFVYIQTAFYFRVTGHPGIYFVARLTCMQRPDNLRLLADLIQSDNDFSYLPLQVKELLRFVKRQVNRVLFKRRHANIINADHGHRTLTRLLVPGVANHGDAVVEADVHRSGKPLTDNDQIAVVWVQEASC